MAELHAARTTDGGVDVVVVAPKDHAILILGVGLGTGTPQPRPTTGSLRGAPVKGAAFKCEARLLVEDIGPQARLPSPPRWEFAGDTDLKTAPVVPAGSVWTGLSVRRHKNATDATLRYVVLPEPHGVVECSAPVREAVETENHGPGRALGWVPVARVRFEATPAQLPSNKERLEGDQALAWPRSKRQFPLTDAPPHPRLFRYAITAEALAGLEVRTTTAKVQ